MCDVLGCFPLLQPQQPPLTETSRGPQMKHFFQVSSLFINTWKVKNSFLPISRGGNEVRKMKELAPGRTANQTRFQASGPQNPLAEPQAASFRTVVESFPGIQGGTGLEATGRPFLYSPALSFLAWVLSQRRPSTVGTDMAFAGRVLDCVGGGLGCWDPPPPSSKHPVPKRVGGPVWGPVATEGTPSLRPRAPYAHLPSQRLQHSRNRRVLQLVAEKNFTHFRMGLNGPLRCLRSRDAFLHGGS